MEKPYPPLNYHDYLCIGDIINAQKPKSTEYGKPVHDEMLFIIIHQIYELWFKQILTDIDSIAKIFSSEKTNESDMGTIISRLDRIVQIQDILLKQIPILETMSPQDFLEFRDFIFPASGFQSFQNRLLENKLGINSGTRHEFDQAPYKEYLKPEQKKVIEEVEKQPSLFDLVERWLERTPFLESEDFSFWDSYRRSVEEMFEKERAAIKLNVYFNNLQKENALKEISRNQSDFDGLFDESSYNTFRKEGAWRFSYKALHAALFINMYRDQPLLQQPYQILNCLTMIDENYTTWRYRHALLAHRMLGKKLGTGGSSGHDYLIKVAEKHKIFTDLLNLTTFFVPRSARPDLPAGLIKKLNFSY